MSIIDDNNLQNLLIEFQVVHKKEDSENIIRYNFAVSFYNLSGGYDYFDNLKEYIRDYVLLNDVDNYYNAESFETNDIEDEQIKEYIEDVLIDEQELITNFTTQKLKGDDLDKIFITNFVVNLRVFEEIFEIVDLETSIIDFVNDFTLRLQHRLETTCVIKLRDHLQKQKYLQYYSEIYDLEMDLRKILTYIFNNRYDDPYNLLNDYELKIPKENQRDKQKHLEHYENEFFMLCFSDYTKICNLQVKGSISNKDLIDFFKNSFTFDEFKQKLELGISNEKHLDFLASIKEDLDSIEKVRNAIMHCRSIPNDIIVNYEKSKSQLQKKINRFWIEQ